MLHRFNTFGSRSVIERLRRAHDAFHNRQVIRVHWHVAHKTLVNLQLSHVQMLQVRQRRVAGSKIVQCKSDAHATAVFMLWHTKFGHEIRGLLARLTKKRMSATKANQTIIF
jgi:hypothetical protein